LPSARPLWVLTFLSGFALIFLSCFMPETSADNVSTSFDLLTPGRPCIANIASRTMQILYRRARRLRKATGNADLKTEGEIKMAETKKSDLVKQTLVRPFVLFLEPIVLVLNLWIGFIYDLLYVWYVFLVLESVRRQAVAEQSSDSLRFESFPLIFEGNHGFNPGEIGLAYMGILVGVMLAMGAFCLYTRKVVEPQFTESKDGKIKPEVRLQPACISAFFIPIALFWSGWTSASTIHWIVPIIGTSFFGIGAFCASALLPRLPPSKSRLTRRFSVIQSFSRASSLYVTSLSSFRGCAVAADAIDAPPVFDRLVPEGCRQHPRWKRPHAFGPRSRLSTLCYWNVS
jgi:DHA1 family multidrug resistance protein-like MFS transporter